jgi:hypothetical protein
LHWPSARILEKDHVTQIFNATKPQHANRVGRYDDKLLPGIVRVSGDTFDFSENESLKLGMQRDLGLINQQSSHLVIMNRRQKSYELKEAAGFSR